MNDPENLIAALERAATSARGVRFIQSGTEDLWISYRQLALRAGRAARRLHAAGIAAGDKVVLVLRTSPTFYDAFLGALYLGAIPVPIYPPLQLGALESWRRNTADTAKRLQIRFAVANHDFASLVESASEHLCVLTLEDLPASGRMPRKTQSDEVTLIQLSSGTTGEPKGVQLTHGQILANVSAIRSLILSALPERDRNHVVVSWLPLYHDMGLIGSMLTSLVHAAELVLIPPEVFVARPGLWLEAISTWRATVSPAPNFALGYCAQRVTPEQIAHLDLSCWKLIISGAEAVTHETWDLFRARFKPAGLDPNALTPAYGLAEAGLIVTAGSVKRPPRFVSFNARILADAGRAQPATGRQALCLASLGKPVKGVEISIRSADGVPLSNRHLGEIHIKGPSLMLGYDQEPTLREPWLDTGDLGFIFDGDLFLYGRKKDVLIIRSRNFAPEPFEQAATSVPGVRGRSAAFSVPDPSTGTESVVVVVERVRQKTHSDAEIVTAVKRQVRQHTGFNPCDVAVWAPGALPRTSNGKIRRSASRGRYLVNLQNQLEPH